MTRADALACAARLADAARAAIAAGSRVPENKLADGYDPVTECDRAAERAMRALIAAAQPDHGVAGEEYGDARSDAQFVWSLDPIDGTRAFICGLPSWTTLIALLDNGTPAAGLIDAPALRERFTGHGDAAWLNGTPIRTSDCRNLAEARLASTDPYLFTGAEADAFARLRQSVRLTRFGWDAYAYARLATGTLDLVAESGLKPHDYNALVPVVRGAGGVVGNWSGGDELDAGQILAAATPALFEQAVRILNLPPRGQDRAAA